MNTFEEYINSELPIKKELLWVFAKKKPSVIFDIGACEGEDSIRYSLLFNTATIFSFEPLPNNYTLCLNNFSKFPDCQIKAFQFALSNKDGVAIFFVSSGKPENVAINDWNYGNKSSSLYTPDSSYKQYDWLKFEKQIQVRIKKISSFCKDQFIENIDFLHIDVQGAEMDVLKGAEDKLNTIRAIWLEVENVSMYEGQPLRKDIEKFMKQSNFVKIIDTSIFGAAGDQLYINSIYFSRLNKYVVRLKMIIILKFVYFKLIPIKVRIIIKSIFQ